MNSLISVIVPMYNSEKWIESCCRSVLEQTYSEFELIVIDDGSTDNSLEIVENMKTRDSRIKAIHTENYGVCHARNVGLDMAQGEYVTFLDADDTLQSDALKTMYNLMREKNCDIVVCNEQIVKPDGSVTSREYTDDGQLWTGEQALVKSLEDNRATYSVWAKLFKKSVVQNVRFTEGKKVHEDSYFMFCCFLNNPHVYVKSDIVLNYNVTENSASREVFSEKLFDILYFAEEKTKIIYSDYPHLKDKVNNVKIKANMALLGNLRKVNNKKYRKVEKDCISAIVDLKDYFVPLKSDILWFFIITHHLYFIDKFVFNKLLKIRKLLK